MIFKASEFKFAKLRSRVMVLYNSTRVSFLLNPKESSKNLVQMAAIYPPQTISPLTSRPEVTSMIQMEEETGIKNEAARAIYNSTKQLLGPDEWEHHARSTKSHIEGHLRCARIGLPEGSSLFSLGSLHCHRTKKTVGDPPTIEGGNPERVNWRIHHTFEDCNKSLPNPHAIIILTSDVPANNAKHCLTLHEMQAILGIMVIRTSHRPFRSHPLHPALLTYTFSIALGCFLHRRKARKNNSGFFTWATFNSAMFPTMEFCRRQKSTG
ncbi:hypothetical protein N7486_004037 [Penicillium sp. IBT 16267x]|nr:hypothetical protein N7486_004037 [Penicillium sp. IBT 16267x]